MSSIIALIGYAWSVLQNKRRTNQRTGVLVESALRRLVSQQRLHIIDPSSAPFPFVSTSQLRDHILGNRFSTRDRLRLWSAVSASVEANANVRTAQNEIYGELHRTWEYTGDINSFLDTEISDEEQVMSTIWGKGVRGGHVYA